MSVSDILETRNAFSFEVFPQDRRRHGKAVW